MPRNIIVKNKGKIVIKQDNFTGDKKCYKLHNKVSGSAIKIIFSVLAASIPKL